jgi:membrane protein
MDKLKKAAGNMYLIFVKHRVTRSAAAMSYYITMSIFPILIVVYSILSSLQISSADLYGIWREILPADVLKVLLDYMQYVGGHHSTFMLFIGIAVTLSSSSTMFSTLIKIMADIQGKSRYRGFWAAVYNIIVSIGFLAVIYISALVIVSGEWLIGTLQAHFGGTIFDIWSWMRFAILFVLLYTIIYLVYQMTAPKERERVRRMPGALIATVLLVAVSIIFSRLISLSVNYPVIYGSLASFIILMLWIYICSIILIMGNVFNISYYHKNLRIDKPGGDDRPGTTYYS